MSNKVKKNTRTVTYSELKEKEKKTKTFKESIKFLIVVLGTDIVRENSIV